MEEVFRLERERVIGNDWVVRYENRYFQVKRHGRHYAPAKGKVKVCEWESGRLELRYRGQKVEWRRSRSRQHGRPSCHRKQKQPETGLRSKKGHV